MRKIPRWRFGFVWAIIATVWMPACGLAGEPSAATPEGRAVGFLAVEVPKWTRDNKCYSCHNNGDAARTLAGAVRLGALADRAPLDHTLRFLARPDGWDANGPEGPFKDKKLARIQFAAALAEGNRAGLLSDRDALQTAAALVAELQTADGNWETDVPGNVGSPVTYGGPLASALAAQTLRMADRTKYRGSIAKASRWFETTQAKSVLDAAATMLALANTFSPAASARRAQCLELVRRGQSSDGGWGPYANSPPEVFDTAVVVLALRAQKDQSALGELISRGRDFLVAAQEPDGGWPATTRPAGADSYAQRVSTTAWATQALLATRGK
jgi:hypothetical protein